MAWVASSGCLSAAFVVHPYPATTSVISGGRKCSLFAGVTLPPLRQGTSRRGLVVCMAPEEEKMTRRSPLDFPIVFRNYRGPPKKLD